MLDFILVTIILVAYIILGLLVYSRNPKNRTNRIFSFFILSLIIWIICNFLGNEPIDDNLRILFFRLDFA